MWDVLALNDHNRVLPPHVLKLLEQARVALQQWRYEEAEKLLNQAIGLVKEA